MYVLERLDVNFPRICIWLLIGMHNKAKKLHLELQLQKGIVEQTDGTLIHNIALTSTLKHRLHYLNLIF